MNQDNNIKINIGVDQSGTFGMNAKNKQAEIARARKIGSQIMRKAIIPSTAHLKQSLSYMDLGVKLEFLNLEMTSNMFWCSFGEIYLFVMALVFFIVDSSEMGSFWWFLFHLVKGIIGLILLKFLPKTHDIIQNAHINYKDKFKPDQVFEQLALSAQTGLDHFTTKTQKFMKIYFGLTIACFFIDIMMFIGAVKDMGTKKVSPYADTAIFAISFLYVLMDGYYIAWVNSLQHRVPPFISSGINQVALGSLDKVYSQVGEKIKESKEKSMREQERSRTELGAIDVRPPPQPQSDPTDGA